MTRRLLMLACASMLLCGGNAHVNAQSASSVTSSTDAKYVEGVVRVKLQREVADRLASGKLPLSVKGTKQKFVKTGVARLDRANEQVKAVSLTRVFPYAGKDEAKHKAAGLDLWYDVTYETSAMKTAQVRNLYRSIAGVSVAQRIPIYKTVGSEKYITVSPEQIAKAAKAASTMPAAQKLPFNDPLLNQQWHYTNDGSLNGAKAGADINLYKAWASGTYGAKDVIVAIVDGGFDTTHPDLKDNLWINEAELNGQPGVDDDGDGYVDDIYGYNFVVNSANINAHEHGTHVAGTVGATNGNGLGVCGVAGGNDGTGGVKMIVCQVFDNRASSTAVSNFAGALVYAADRGASIAQCSWGMSAPDNEDTATSEAVHYFTKNGGGDKMNGGLCIFASGNNGDEGNYYPGCLDDCVAVGSMAPDGSVAYYSNYGTWVDVTAPGGLVDNGQKYGVLSTLPNATYGFMEGTSMACPHVSGVAALILSKYGNKNFSNETLRTMLTTSVNDLYTQNPDYVGKMGSGYIDAYKALQGKEGSTPNGVEEFVLTPSHDNIRVEWIIPDCEEKAIDHHVLYYSTEPFTVEDDLSKLNSVSIDTKFKSSGDAMTYELTGLKASTKYYLAMVAYSRWGKASTVSPVKEATTNAGPKVGLDQTSLSMSIDANKSKTAEAEFKLQNTGEGVLKYELTTSTSKATYSTQSRGGKPNPGQVVPFTGSFRAATVQNNKVESADFQQGEWPKNLFYGKLIYAYLGETDTKLPNAMAQYYSVDSETYPDGFNLTHLNISGQNGQEPEIEIYDGSRSISVAGLLQKVNYSYWMYDYDIALPEQMHFAPGSSFWVVVKFPAGAKNPLGAWETDGTDYSQYSFYSSDNGATWTQLNQVLKGSAYESVADNFTWGIKAISKNPDWSSVLNPDPVKGEVRPGESQKISLKNDGQQLVNGTYKFNIHVKSNEAVDSKKKVALTMNVTGYKPEMHSKQLIDFGDLLIGQSKSLDVELVNNGFGAFSGEYGDLYAYDGAVSCSSDQFDVSQGAPSIAARSSNKMTVTFKPTQAGNFSGTVTLKDKNGNKHSFLVRGVASVPATLETPETEFNLGDLKSGEEKTAIITLKNTGNYPLQYVFPKFSSEKIEGSTGRVHKFGYTSISNVAGADEFQYEPAPELPDETDITSQFNDNTWFSSPINLGFKFPFYGKEYEQVYVTSYGAVTMNPLPEGYHFSCTVPTSTCVEGVGYISGFANSGWLSFGTNSKVTYGHKDGKLYVKFVNALCPDMEGGTSTVSFHMVLCPDGSTEVYYDDYNPESVFINGGLNFVGVSDVDVADPYVFIDSNKINDMNDGLNAPYYDIFTGSAIKIVAPARSMVKGLSSADGYVGINESKDITVTVSGNDNLYAGELTNYLTVVTNDPNNASKNFTLKANVVGDDLKPEAKLQEESVDFGNVFRTSVQNHYLTLQNSGKDVLQVSGVSVKGGKFAVADDAKDGFSVNPGECKDIVITLPTENEGAVEDVLVITYKDGASQEVAVKGTVIGTPVWNVNPEAIEETTPYQVNVNKTITVSNSGNEDMKFTVQPDSWFTSTNLEADGKTGDIDYVYQSKSEGLDVAYDWQDIVNDYTEHMPFSYYIDKTDFKKVTLPFEFPFYGKKYKEMYIYNTGFVSFDEPIEDYKQFPEPPIGLPTKDCFYSNIICPFWGNHTMNTPSRDGVYYKAKDDEVIVSYKNYGNTMMRGMNFQVILRKDGTYKFQYNLDDDGFFSSPFGLAGAMDHSGSRGFVTPPSYITPGNAVEFAPRKSYVVAPNASVDVPLELHADQLADVYNYELNVTTNVPSMETVTVPVTLNITGETDAVFPETIDIEQPADPYGMELYKEFAVVNKGTKAFTITNIGSDMFNAPEDDPWAYPMAQLLVYTKVGNGGGDPDPGPLSLSDDSEMAWMPYYPGMSEPIVVGKDSVKFRIQVFNSMEVTQATYPLYFEVMGLPEEMYESQINLNITEAPYMVFDQEELHIENVSDDFVSEASIQMQNAGAYKLTYSLRLDPAGHDEITDDFEGGFDPALSRIAPALSKEQAKKFFDTAALKINAKNVMKAMGIKRVKDDQKYFYDVPEGNTDNLIYYPVLNPVSSAVAAVMGTGTTDLDDNFYAATRYEAPAEGFNLTHLYFVGTVGTLENVDIEASVILGNDVTATEKTVGHGKIHIDKEEPGKLGYIGVPRMLEFDKPVYINPTDTFYVVLKYPAGYGASAMMASKDGDKEMNRYMGYSKGLGGWLDLEEAFDEQYGYGAFGYFMTCVEHEKGEPWIKLLNDKTEGEVAPGDVLPINFAVNAKAAYFDKNNVATLVVKSNDPMQKTVNYHIYLDKNSAPVITVPQGTLTVAEAGKAVASVQVVDEEGDAFTVAVSDNVAIAQVESYANAEGTQDGITLKDGVYSVEAGQSLVLNVALTPDFATAGAHSFEVVANDENNNTRSATVQYVVEHTNQAPKFVGPAVIELDKSVASANYRFDSFFEEPDGDKMTYTASVDNELLAKVYRTEDSFIIKSGKLAGKTNLNVTAVDAEGASTTGVITLAIATPTGIDQVEADGAKGDVTINGDVCDGKLDAVIGVDADKVVLAVYNNAGQLCAQKTLYNVHAGEKVSVALGNVVTGVCHLVATVDGKTSTVKFAAK